MLAADGAPLSALKPNVTVGLELDAGRADESFSSDRPHQALVLSLEFLKAARMRRRGLHPSPIYSTIQLAYPCLVYEPKSNAEPLMFAENQAAGAAAMALTTVDGLQAEVATLPGGHRAASRALPIVALCSIKCEFQSARICGMDTNHACVHACVRARVRCCLSPRLKAGEAGEAGGRTGQNALQGRVSSSSSS